MIRYRNHTSNTVQTLNSSGPQYTSHSQGKKFSEPQIEVDSRMNGDILRANPETNYTEISTTIFIFQAV